jgi:hypothetical protein
MRTRHPCPALVARSAFAVSASRPTSSWWRCVVPAFRPVLPPTSKLVAERDVQVDHVTVCRWVQRVAPLLAEAARPCRHGIGGPLAALLHPR